MSEPDKQDFRARDVDTFLIIGAFVVLLSLPVAVGILWEPDFHARVVTIFAATALFLIGGGMVVRSFVLRKRLK